MTAHHVYTSNLLRSAGIPLILTEDTSDGDVTTTISAANTWYALNLPTMDLHGTRTPDWTGTDIAGADHKIEPAWSSNFNEQQCYMCLNFNAISAATASNIIFGLWDIQNYSSSLTADCELLASVTAPIGLVGAADSLVAEFVFTCLRTADLRLYVKNTTGAHNLVVGDGTGDHLQLYLRCL